MTEERAVVLDAAGLRVLAHPIRIAMLNRLRQYGPATARQLSGHYAIDSGAASYHLRRLAEGDLIEEDVDRGSKRDRWWRARHPTSFHDPAARPASEREDSRAYVQASVLAYGELLRRLAGEVVPVMPEDWFGASTFSDYTLRLTPDQLSGLKAELAQVIGRYRSRGAGNDSAARVSVQLQAFPLLEHQA
jgi:DNA-binding transcriptional ArsR family regulator